MCSRLSENLLNAVKPYLGKPYEKIDCYELVVKGIKNLGFRYQGPGGLKEHLVSRAVEQGLPENAYLTGEGLINASGIQVYSKSITGIQDPDMEAARAMEEMNSQLCEGNILSFSTPTLGHVGIISQRRNRWTFINSGRMDHNIEDRQRAKEVGEENLPAEIKNWFRRAAARKETLQITVGRLDGQKLASFLNPRSRIEERV